VVGGLFIRLGDDAVIISPLAVSGGRMDGKMANLTNVGWVLLHSTPVTQRPEINFGLKAQTS
jgi:hypothetical protein